MTPIGDSANTARVRAKRLDLLPARLDTELLLQADVQYSAAYFLDWAACWMSAATTAGFDT